ncbi:MAG: hypothetical protein R6X27_00480 [Candidatus Desulfacyla sp.]
MGRNLMDDALAIQEGFITFRGYKVWYGIAGKGEAPGKAPFLCLHGGPGGTHDHLEPSGTVAGTGRRVIFHDPLGVGNSDHPSNPAMWTLHLFLEELASYAGSRVLTMFILKRCWGR